MLFQKDQLRVWEVAPGRGVVAHPTDNPIGLEYERSAPTIIEWAEFVDEPQLATNFEPPCLGPRIGDRVVIEPHRVRD